jgi:nucleotide-binding universal stress UspA family protein
MLQPKLVLAPIDFSSQSQQAVETATDIASKFGAGLLLVHVVAALPKFPPDVSIFKEGEYERRLHEEAVRRIGEISTKYTRNGVSVRSEVGIANDVGMELLRIAEHNKADLIVIATHGMTGWNKLVFGSVAEKVLRLANIPVLLLRSSPEGHR